jgi:hypothetical protein
LCATKLFRSVFVARGTLPVPVALMLQRNTACALVKCAREKGSNDPVELGGAAVRTNLSAVRIGRSCRKLLHVLWNAHR